MVKKILSSKESELFRLTIGKVEPVKKDKILLKKGEKPKPFPKPQAINRQDYLLSMTETDVEKLNLEDTMSFIAAGLQKNVLKKLRQGYFELDAEIDLHGLNSNEAKRQLLNFLHGCVEDGFRCVLVVHGKGYRSPDNHPVLKNNLNLWLRQHKDVQAFCSAPPKQGGTGAVFVLLYLSDKYDNQGDAEY
ncbi:Smr protein/MutS2 [Candidatus Methylobacter favarea]|uniref:Smr protein/MutS2 n=1 Tax=Candidatus Methylobacter favarea TaxID=2707345 RepID=A0A8S0XEJ9_9GAMM|nr:Smr/MutS family protein [Candidatus Methylobacter favarea]CAA9889792.1 Smr protein/MutS2 [Candidatus Methylobacter favarea]